MRFSKRTVLVLGLLAGVLPLCGQEYRTFQDELAAVRERARWRLGPLRLVPTLQIRNIGYDNNVYYRTQDGHPVGDYTGTIAPDLKAYLLLGSSLILSFQENPEYVFYAREKGYRSFANSYAPGVKLNLFRRFVLSGNYQNQKHRRRVSPEIDYLTTDLIRGGDGGFFFETVRKTALGITGNVRRYSYEAIRLPGSDAPLSRELGREEKTGQLEFYYRLYPENFFFLDAGYTDVRFLDQSVAWRNVYSYQTSGGIRFSPTGRVRGLLTLGWKKLVPRAAGRKGFQGLTARTELEVRLGRIVLNALHSRDSNFSYWTNVIYFIDHRYGAGLSFYLNRSLRLDYKYQQGRMNYPENISYATPEGPVILQRKDRDESHSLGFMVRLFQRTGVGISADYWKKRSNLPGTSIDRWFIGGYLSYEF